MPVTIELPKDLEATLRRQVGNLEGAAKEALLVELYRQGQLTHRTLAEALGLDRYEADGVLKRHGVEYDLTPAELNRQLQSLRPGSD